MDLPLRKSPPTPLIGNSELSLDSSNLHAQTTSRITTKRRKLLTSPCFMMTDCVISCLSSSVSCSQYQSDYRFLQRVLNKILLYLRLRWIIKMSGRRNMKCIIKESHNFSTCQNLLIPWCIIFFLYFKDSQDDKGIKSLRVYSLLQVGECKYFLADFTQYLPWQACSSMSLSQTPGGHAPVCSLSGAP